ncbi:MAG TPA: LytTR family DNA-binding domain-containing protein [Bacteroidales bacterium]
MFKAIIIDDDEISCSLITEMIQNYFPEIEVKVKAHSFYSGIKEIHKHHPDLIFLDMELPDGKGYEIFNMTFSYPFKIIFVTAYKDYAYEAINHSPAGYILKPVTVSTFVDAIHKALPEANTTVQATKVTYHQNPDPDGCLVVKTMESVYVIHKKDIIRCESSQNYTTIYQIGEKGIMVSITLKKIEECLPYPQFLRVHNSHLVSTKYIKRVDKMDCCLQMTDNSMIPIACRKKEQVMEYLDSLNS